MSEYGGYKGSNIPKSHQNISMSTSESNRYNYSNLSAKRKFLEDKYHDDLRNAKFWRQFTIGNCPGGLE